MEEVKRREEHCGFDAEKDEDREVKMDFGNMEVIGDLGKSTRNITASTRQRALNSSPFFFPPSSIQSFK